MLFLQVKKEQLEARKTKDKIKATLLTTLLGELQTEMKSRGVEATDEMVIAKCKKFLKGNEELIKTCIPGDDRYIEANIEKQILESFLPKQLTEDELRNIIVATGLNDVGQIMKFLKENHAGQYNGKLASQVAKEFNQ